MCRDGPGKAAAPRETRREPGDPRRASERSNRNRASERTPLRATQAGRIEQPVMILPQVHLRKPCYDFYFL